MPEWLKTTLESPSLSLAQVALQLSLALVAGFLVALLARAGRRDLPAADTFPITLVMLCVLIALVTQVVGDNVARAFSLAGALSIIRFRTIVRDTQDTAFVMLAVVVGMGIGSSHFLATAIGMAVISVAVAIARLTPVFYTTPVIESQIAIRVGLSAEPDTLLAPLFGQMLERYVLVSAETARQGTALDLTYRIVLRRGTDPVAFLAQLNKVAGVESVHWAERAEET
jgi:hypothetical protein